MSLAALTTGEGRLEKVEVVLADGSVFDLGYPGTRRHHRLARKLIRRRLKTEPAFRAAFGDIYTKRGKLR